VEGICFSVPLSASTESCHICISNENINRNTRFSSNYMLQIFVLFSMGKFVIHVNGLCLFI
jgi:hypothetical protein